MNDTIRGVIVEQGARSDDSKIDLDAHLSDSRSKLSHCLRSAIAGGLPGPSMIDVLVLLGREVSLKRLEGVIATMHHGSN